MEEKHELFPKSRPSVGFLGKRGHYSILVTTTQLGIHHLQDFVVSVVIFEATELIFAFFLAQFPQHFCF